MAGAPDPPTDRHGSDPHDADARDFEHLLELDPGARDAWLDARRRMNPGQVARLEALLAADGALDERLLDRAPLAEPEHAAGDTVGPFRILGELGRGGMGIVYEAEQDRPKRRVALKVLRPDPVDAAVRRRFEFEGELLARLEHPGIARVYQVGEEHGRPFIAMERVDGLAIDRWIEERRPPQAGVVELLALVAEAVAHAHERGVVHRDLKPANVLVDSEGRPKVLDFGIARALDRDAGEDSLRTRAGELWGTLATMAPEQAAGRSEAIGTPTDVYALGVLGYRLLTGRFPHDVPDLPLQEGLRLVAEAPIPRPARFDPRLRGDLETLLMHALEKEPARRYGSAAEFARDLRRFLTDQPILARPPSAVYQLSRFARRHRVVVLATGLVAASLVAGTIVSTRLYLQAQSRGERLDAALTLARESEARTAERTAELLAAEDFFDSVLSEASPLEDGADVRVVDALERTVARLDQLDVSPAVRARLLRRLGATLLALDRRESARATLGEALATMEAEDPARLEVRAQLARLQWETDQDAAALDEFESAVEAARVSDWSATPEAFELRRARANALAASSRIEDAERALDEARALARALSPREEALVELSRANIDLSAGRMESAITRLGSALVELGGLSGDDSFEVLAGRQLLATAQYYIGDYEAALATATESLAGIEALVDGPHGALLGPLELICLVRIEQSELDEAERVIDRALAIARELNDEGSLEVANLLVQRAGVYEYSGRLEAAFADYDLAVGALRQGAPTLTLVSALAQLGALHLREGNLEQAIPPLDESAALHAELTTPTDLRRGWTLRALGQAQDRSGRTAEALVSHRASFEIVLANEELTGPGQVIENGVSVAEMLIDLGRGDEALEQLASLTDRVQAFDSEYLTQIHGLQLGAALVEAGQPERGAALVRAAAAFFTADGEYTPRARKRLAELAQD